MVNAAPMVTVSNFFIETAPFVILVSVSKSLFQFCLFKEKLEHNMTTFKFYRLRPKNPYLILHP